jgi:hypothetical protein
VPIAYRIDPEGRRILTHAWGVLTDADILAHKTRLLQDAEFDPGMPQLSDISAIERLEVTSAGVRAMVEHDAANAHRRAGHRMALVVPKSEAFGMARMYELVSGRVDNSVGVFRTREEAEAWLAADGAG